MQPVSTPVTVCGDIHGQVGISANLGTSGWCWKVILHVCVYICGTFFSRLIEIVQSFCQNKLFTFIKLK